MAGHLQPLLLASFQPSLRSKGINVLAVYNLVSVEDPSVDADGGASWDIVAVNRNPFRRSLALNDGACIWVDSQRLMDDSMYAGRQTGSWADGCFR